MTRKEREIEERNRSASELKSDCQNMLLGHNCIQPNNNLERSPLLPKDITVSIGYGTQQEHSKKMKTEINRRRKQSLDEDADNEESNRDWWTKYFASVEEMINEIKEARKLYNADGSIQMNLSDDSNAANNAITSSIEKSPNEPKKRFGFKTAATASRFAARISPKSFRKKNKVKTALCKVSKVV